MLVLSLSERIECLPRVRELVRQAWPDWFAWDGLDRLSRVLEASPNTQLLGFDGQELVAVANAVTVPFDGPLDELPDRGGTGPSTAPVRDRPWWLWR